MYSALRERGGGDCHRGFTVDILHWEPEQRRKTSALKCCKGHCPS